MPRRGWQRVKRTGSQSQSACGFFSTAVGPMANAGEVPKFLRWGHAQALSESLRLLYLGAINEPTAALAQHHSVANRLEFWQGWTATPGFAQHRLRNAGELVRIGPSLGMADFISNSAIWSFIPPTPYLMWCLICAAGREIWQSSTSNRSSV